MRKSASHTHGAVPFKYFVREQAFRAHEAAAYEVFATEKGYGGLSSEAATHYSSPARNVTGLRKFNVLE